MSDANTATAHAVELRKILCLCAFGFWFLFCFGLFYFVLLFGVHLIVGFCILNSSPAQHIHSF